MSSATTTRDIVALARAAGLRLPLAPGREWQPSTSAEQHLLVEARRLDHLRQTLLAEIGRLRAQAPRHPRTGRLELARIDVPPDCPLPPGKLEALAAAAHGETVAAAARRLRVSTDTVSSQRQRAVQALGARSITHAVALAVAAGWIPVGTPTGGTP